MIYYIHQLADTALQALKDKAPSVFYSTNSDFDIAQHNRKWNRFESKTIRDTTSKHRKNILHNKRVSRYADFITKMATEKDKWLYIE